MRFALGAFERGDPLAGGSSIQPASRLELVLVDAEGAVQQTLTPPDGARDLLPAEYAYRLTESAHPRPRRRRVPLPGDRPRATSRPAADPPFARVHRQVKTVTLYTRPGCHLCDDARAALLRLQRSTPFTLEEIDIEGDDALHRAYLERIPVIHARRGPRLRLLPRRGGAHRAAQERRLEWLGHELRRRRDQVRRHARRRGRWAAGRPAFAGCRCPTLPLPPGPDPGPEDGQGDDLLPGAVGVHARQLHADPPRPLRLRQVRQARGRLQRRLAGLPDPQDPADLRPAQHRAVRRRPPRQGDRLERHLRRPRLPRRRDLRPREGEDRREGRQHARSAIPTTSSRSSRRRTSSSACWPSRPPPRSRSPISS